MATWIKRGWPVGVLLAVILFPFGWLGERWPAFGDVLGTIFSGNRGHAVGHSILFGLLGLMLLSLWPALRRHAGAYFAWVGLAGLGQEAFQLLYKQRPLGFDDFRDLAVDLVAAGLVLLAAQWRRRPDRPRTTIPN
ncbi:MAG TPA: hypothetical protein VM536_05810 [Chloroflexia bacterium]|nr:hypothetical protein [Chloroflexia bacterium]